MDVTSYVKIKCMFVTSSRFLPSSGYCSEDVKLDPFVPFQIDCTARKNAGSRFS